MIEFITGNWEGILLIAISAVVLAEKIVALTPTKKDDEIVAKVRDVITFAEKLKEKKGDGSDAS